jgi:hypothetical protein
MGVRGQLPFHSSSSVLNAQLATHTNAHAYISFLSTKQMGRKKNRLARKLKRLFSVGNGHRDAETAARVNACLQQEDVAELRDISTTKGLVSGSLRKRAWPYLIDARATNVYGAGDEALAYQRHASTSHKDDSVVDADIERSLWKFSEGWTDEERAIERARLKNIINACLEGNEQGIYYYQGLHDVASVLLLVCGEGAAHGMLHRLMRCHLRDCTRATMDPAIRTLRLLYPILRRADKELYECIHGLSLIEPALEMPYFALSWYMTWFAHDTDSLEDVSRLFDLFMASHPMMSLYVAAEVLVGARKQILKLGKGKNASVEDVYSYLNKLSITGPGRPGIDELIKRAVALFKAVPPQELTSGKLKRDLVGSSSVPFAYLDADGRWLVPPVDDHTEALADIKSFALSGRRSIKPSMSSMSSLRALQDSIQTQLHAAGYSAVVGAAAVVIAGVVTATSSWS